MDRNRPMAWAVGLLAALRRDDRGEIIPTAIIYAVAGAVALMLLTAASDYVTGWIGIWPDAAAPVPPAP